MNFSQFIDFLLWALYTREREHGAGQYVDLSELAETLHEPIDRQWVFDAGKVLESRGLARGIFALGGYTAAMLTGEGRLYVEERLGLEDTFLRQIADDPD